MSGPGVRGGTPWLLLLTSGYCARAASPCRSRGGEIAVQGAAARLWHCCPSGDSLTLLEAGPGQKHTGHVEGAGLKEGHLLKELGSCST